MGRVTDYEFVGLARLTRRDGDSENLRASEVWLCVVLKVMVAFWFLVLHLWISWLPVTMLAYLYPRGDFSNQIDQSD
jgi:hypothetical protein